MGNLEHNIKEAFNTHDAKTELANKNNMWVRLDNQMGTRKGVAGFWRVAAVLLGVFLLTGAFATLRMKAKYQTEMDNIKMENASLTIAIDSLISLPAATKTEIQIVEKEKVVYRERKVVQQNSDAEKYWEKRYKELTDSSDLILANNNKQAKEITQLQEELDQSEQELLKFKQALKLKSKKEPTAPFELKSEQIDVGVSKKPVVKNPEMKMKVFQKNFIENKNNLNSTIFRR